MNRFKMMKTVHGFSPQALWLMLCMLFVGSGTAWADGGNEAKIGSTEYATLAEAFENAAPGETVVLLKDVDVTGQSFSQYTSAAIGFVESITFDGGGHTLTVDKQGLAIVKMASNTRMRRLVAAAPVEGFEVTIQNITIKNVAKTTSYQGGRCITTRGDLKSLTLDGVTLTTEGSQFNRDLQPLFVGGEQSTAPAITIKNSKITTGSAVSGKMAVAISLYNPAQVSIEGTTTLNATNAVRFFAADNSAGAAGSVVAIDGATITAAGEALYFADNDNQVTVENSTVSAASQVAYVGSTSGNQIKLNGANNTITFGETITDAADNTVFAVAGGKFGKVVADKYLADGYICHKVAAADGKFLVEEGEYAARIGEEGYPTLYEALACVNEGETISMVKDEDETGYSYDSNHVLAIRKSITIEGNNNTLTLAKRGLFVGGTSANIDVTFKNITMLNNASAGRCINTRGLLGSLTLEGVTLTTEDAGHGWTQPLTIGGNQSDKATVTIKNSNISSASEAKNGYAITTFNPVDMTIDGSTVQGWACLNIKGKESSAGSAGSTFSVTNSKFISANGSPGLSNSFSAIKIEDDNVKVAVTGTTVNVNGAANSQGIVSFQNASFNPSNNCEVSLGEGNVINMEGEYYFAAHEGTSTALAISGGTFNVEIPEKYCAEDFIPVKNADGTYGVKEGEFIVDGNDGYGYETLQDAVAAGNITLTLRASHAADGVFTTTALSVAADVTIDLNALTLNLSEGLQLNAGTLTFTNGAVKGAVVANGGTLAFDDCETNEITVTGDKSLNLATGTFKTNIDGKYLAEHFATNLINNVYVVKGTIQISTVDELVAFGALSNNATTAAATAGNTYELTADLDLTDIEWTPAGGLDAYPGTAFKGTFDGKGHTISNLTCTDTHANYATAALFGATSGYAVIKNLTLKDVNITSTHYAAGFVAYEGAESNYTTIENCHVIGGSIVSKPELLSNGEYDNGDKVGGIVGYTVRTDIKNCSVEGVTMQAYRDLGGLAGFMQNNPGTVLEGNTVRDVTLTQSDENGYKTNADGSLQDMSSTVGEVVGGRSGADVIAQANDEAKNTSENVTITEPSGFLAKIGDVKFPSFSAAVAAIKNMVGTDFVIDMFGDGTLDITAWSGTNNSYSIGKEDTESITINGNSHKLTFNQHNSDWDNVATMNDAKTKLILNDMTINNSGYNNGPWNRYDINFNCAVELNNVVAEKAVAFKNDVTMNNFTVNDDNDVYAIWIQTNGQKVVMNDVKVNAPNGRGIAVKDQYVDAAPETMTSLQLDNVTFNTKKKAAILVTAQYGAEIAAANLDITSCDADSENAVWVSDDRANLYGEVTLTGDATMIPEGGVDAYTVVRTTGEKVNGYYTDLAKAVDEATDGQTITLKADGLNLTASKTVKNFTIDGNGHNVLLNEGVIVNIDQENDIFVVADETCAISKRESDGGYIYEAKKADAQIAEVKYAYLDEALAAAEAEQTVALLQSVTLSKTSTLAAPITITLGENNITKGDYSLAIANDVTITTDKDVDVFTAAGEGYAVTKTAEHAYTAQAAVARIGDVLYATFDDAYTVLQANDEIELLANITLTKNYNSPIETGALTLTQVEKLNANGHTIALNDGVTVTTDREVELFVAANEGSIINKTTDGDKYSYAAQQQGEGGVYAFVDGDAGYTKTADEEVEKVTYTRSFGEERVDKYQAWFLPFDYAITEDDLENFTFYKINMIANAEQAGEAEATEDVWIFVNQVEAGYELKANKPYVFKPKAAVDGYEFVSEDVTLKAKADGVLLQTATTEATYSFYGTYTTTSLAPSDTHRDFYMSIDGDLSYPKSSTVAVGPYRWYLRMETKNDADYARGIGFMEGGDEGVTGLRNIVTSEDGISFYTLSGVRVQTPGKGVYIMRSADGTTKKVSFK